MVVLIKSCAQILYIMATKVIEAICASRKAEGWMVKKYQKDKAFWKSLGVASPQMYIGSQTGMFRIFPGRQSRECGSYDPRERPWYKGAVPNTISSAAPRHVVFLLDKSLSMGEPMGPYSNATKLDYMKQVVTSTLSFLTDRDSVAGELRCCYDLIALLFCNYSG